MEALYNKIPSVALIFPKGPRIGMIPIAEVTVLDTFHGVLWQKRVYELQLITYGIGLLKKNYCIQVYTQRKMPHLKSFMILVAGA